MRLKTQSHLITIAVTGLVVWQIAQATHSEPSAPPAVQLAAQHEDDGEEASESATRARAQIPGMARRVRRDVPLQRPSFELFDGGYALEVEPAHDGTIKVRDLVAQLASLMGTSYTVDPQAADVRVTLGGETLINRQQLRGLLRSVDVCLVAGPAGVLQAYHTRNVSQLTPPATKVAQDDESLDPDQFVTRVVPVYHGSGNAIFATVRGLITRDTARVSNVLYVQGSEVIIVSDFAHNVHYYEQLIQTLDVPPAELVTGE